MEKETRRKNKITPFPAPGKRKKGRRWEETFGRQLRREAEELETELEGKPELKDIDASSELFNRIIDQLRNEGKWEEETAEELTPDVRSLLSKKDREALDIGRRIQEQGRRGKVRRCIGIAAVVVLCVFLVTMSSEANREYAVGVINAITGSRWGIYVEDAEKNTIKYSEDEREAYKNIEEQLGILVPQMQYRPSGMEFKSYQINTDKKSGAIFYQYGETIIITYLYGRTRDVAMQQTFNAHIIDKIEIDTLELQVNLYELENEEEDFYAGEMEHNGCYYVIVGKIEKGEFKKMLQNIIF